MQRPLQRYNTNKSKTLWASKPWHGRLGTYIGIRLEAGQVWVAIWKPKHTKRALSTDALSEDEARDWARSSRWR